MNGRFVTACESASRTFVEFAIFSPSVPEPEPVEAVTVQVAVFELLTGVTPVIVGVPPRPPLTRTKFAAVRPVTGSVNVTVHDTLAALVGLGPARAMLCTSGAFVGSFLLIV